MSEEQVLWECQDQMNPNYFLKVVRTSPYKGKLTVAYKNEVFYTEIVPVRYDAQFGPDFEDMNEWSYTACAVTQRHEAEGFK